MNDTKTRWSGQSNAWPLITYTYLWRRKSWPLAMVLIWLLRKIFDTLYQAMSQKVLQRALDLDEGNVLVISLRIYPLSQTEISIEWPIHSWIRTCNIGDARGCMPCIIVHFLVPVMRIAGIVLDASPKQQKGHTWSKTRSLLERGTSNSEDPGNESNPHLGTLRQVRGTELTCCWRRSKCCGNSWFGR